MAAPPWQPCSSSQAQVQPEGQPRRCWPSSPGTAAGSIAAWGRGQQAGAGRSPGTQSWQSWVRHAPVVVAPPLAQPLSHRHFPLLCDSSCFPAQAAYADVPAGSEGVQVSLGQCPAVPGAQVSPRQCPAAQDRCWSLAKQQDRVSGKLSMHGSGSRRPGCPASTQPLHSWQKIAPRGVAQPGKAPSSPGQPMFIQYGGDALPSPCQSPCQSGCSWTRFPGSPPTKIHRLGWGVGGNGKPLKNAGFVPRRSSRQ